MAKTPIDLQFDYLEKIRHLLRVSPKYAVTEKEITQLNDKLDFIQQINPNIELEHKWKWMVQTVLDSYFDAKRRMAYTQQPGFFQPIDNPFIEELKSFLTTVSPTSYFVIPDKIDPTTPTLRIFFLTFDNEPRYKTYYGVAHDCARMVSAHCSAMDNMLFQIAKIHFAPIGNEDKLVPIQQILLSKYWLLRQKEGPEPSAVTLLLQKEINRLLSIHLPTIIPQNTPTPTIAEALEMFKDNPQSTLKLS